MNPQRSNGFNILERKVVGTIAILAFCTATAIVMMEVVSRYIFSHSFMWAHETVIYLAAAGAFLYFGIADKESGHLSVNLLPMVIKNNKIRRGFDVMALAISISYGVLCAFITLKLINMFYSNNVRSLNAELPVWIFYACLFLGFVLLIWSMIQKLFHRIKQKDSVQVSN